MSGVKDHLRQRYIIDAGIQSEVARSKKVDPVLHFSSGIPIIFIDN